MSQRPIKLPVFRELDRLLRSLGLRQPVLYYPQNQGTEITVVWKSRLLYLEAYEKGKDGEIEVLLYSLIG